MAITAAQTAWDTVWGAVKTAWDTVTSAIKTAFDNTLAPLFGAGGTFVTAVQAVVGPFKTVVNSLLGGINAIIEAWNALEFKVPSIKIPGVTTPFGSWGPWSIGGFTVGTPNLGTIPMLAAGGRIQSAGSAIVGDDGPELVKLPRGAQVSPLDGGGGERNINFYGPVYGVDDFFEKVNQARLAWKRAGNE